MRHVTDARAPTVKNSPLPLPTSRRPCPMVELRSPAANVSWVIFCSSQLFGCLENQHRHKQLEMYHNERPQKVSFHSNCSNTVEISLDTPDRPQYFTPDGSRFRRQHETSLRHSRVVVVAVVVSAFDIFWRHINLIEVPPAVAR